MQAPGTGRLSALDGLRGWAALSVLIFHFTWESFGAHFAIFRTYPFAVVGNSQLAVGLFFVLSGYVLTRRRWDRATGNLGLTLVARYLRLVLPVLVAVLLTYLIGTFGLSRAHQAGDMVQSPGWLGRFLNFEPTLPGAFRFAAFDVFFVGIAGKYNPFLWTMTIELWGSFVVLGLSQFRVQSWQAIFLVVLTIVALRAYPLAAAMPMGALLALLDTHGHAPFPRRGLLPIVAVLGLLLLAGLDTVLRGVTPLVQVLLAFGIVFLARGDNGFSRFLGNPLSRWLGHLSFPNYLAQFAILTTVTSALIVAASQAGMLTGWTAAGIGLVSLAANFALAYIFVPVEAAAIALSRLVRNGRPKVVALAKSG